MINKPGVPYWRLSGFYFLLFATIGVLLPYWALYLKSLGFDATEIGVLSAMFVFSKIFITYFWGWIVDHTGRRMQMIKVACFLSLVSFSAVLFIHDFYGLLLTIFIFSLFWSAPLPQIEAVTLTHLGESTHSYTVIRIWGSIGFIVSVWLVGMMFEIISIHYVPHIILVCILSAWLVSLSLPEQNITHHSMATQNILPVLLNPSVIALFMTCFLMLASHGAYYTFYSIYLEDNGYNNAFIGQMWALGVIAEVALFLVMHRLIRYFPLKFLLLLSLGLATGRWLLIAFYIDHITLVIFAQCLHAATFGIYHATAIQFIHNIFRGTLQGRGQALYSSASFGAGMTAGSLISGWIWDVLGGMMCFIFAALIAMAGFITAMLWVKE